MYYIFILKDNLYSLYSNKKNILIVKGNKKRFIKYIKIFNKTIEENKYIARHTKEYKKYKKEITIN